MLIGVATLALLRRSNVILRTSEVGAESTNALGCLRILGLTGGPKRLVQRQLHLLAVVQVEWREAGRRLLGVVDGDLGAGKCWSQSVWCKLTKLRSISSSVRLARSV